MNSPTRTLVLNIRNPKIWNPCSLKSLALLLAIAAVSSGCSIKKIAVNKLGDSLADSGTTFASDDDPDLVGEALPFSLKLMEGLLAENPRHRGLLLAASSGFTQYAYVYVQQDAERMEDQDQARAANRDRFAHAQIEHWRSLRRRPAEHDDRLRVLEIRGRSAERPR